MYTFVKQHTHVHVYKYSTSRRSLNVRPIAERVWTVLPPTHKTHAYLRSSAFSCICVPVRAFAVASVRSRLRPCVRSCVRTFAVASVRSRSRPCMYGRVRVNSSAYVRTLYNTPRSSVRLRVCVAQVKQHLFRGKPSAWRLFALFAV